MTPNSRVLPVTCPRCKKPEAYIHETDGFYWVRCDFCLLELGGLMSNDAAVRAWNEAASSKRRIAELEALLSCIRDDATGDLAGKKRVWPIRAAHYRTISAVLRGEPPQDPFQCGHRQVEHLEVKVKRLRDVFSAVCRYLFRPCRYLTTVECDYCGNSAAQAQDIQHVSGCPIASAVAALRGEKMS